MRTGVARRHYQSPAKCPWPEREASRCARPPWPCSSCVVAFQGPYKYWAVRGGAGKTTDLILLVAWSLFQTLLMHYLSESLGKKYINALLFSAVLLPIHQKYCFCAFFIIRFNITNVNKERTPFLFLEIEYVKTLSL